MPQHPSSDRPVIVKVQRALMPVEAQRQVLIYSQDQITVEPLQTESELLVALLGDAYKAYFKAWFIPDGADGLRLVIGDQIEDQPW
jgi:hypothetical protein